MSPRQPDAGEALSPPSRTRPLLDVLREHTRLQHAAVEQAVPILNHDATRSDYTWYLSKLLGFHAPIEARLEASDALGDLDLAARRKVPHLQRDLHALGLSANELQHLPICQRVPAVPDRAAGLGVMYVLEGATLGGQVIHRRLQMQDPALMAQASGYLRCYGEHTGARWKDLLAALDGDFSAAERQGVAESAAETFQTLLDWLRETSD